MYDESASYLDFLTRKGITISTEDLTQRGNSAEILNHALDLAEIHKQYQTDGIVVVDNFLIPKYSLRLRDFTLFYNKKEDIYKDYAAINFYRYDPTRVWFSLLSDIVDQSKLKFNFLSQSDFIRGWSFIYDNISDGVNIHADPAGINLNYWVTPDECMDLASNTNGLDIWTICPPPDWGHDLYNKRPDLCIKYVEEHKAHRVSVPYRFNRLIIFNSKFFHKTQPVRAKPGYENRRVNYTFLYT